MGESTEKEPTLDRARRKGTVPKLLGASIKMLYRDRTGLFWALVFPLLFVLVFGLFGKTSSVGTVTIVDEARNESSAAIKTAFEEAKSFTVKADDYSVEEAREAIKDNKTGLVVIIPRDFQIGAAAPELTVVSGSGNVLVNSSAMNLLTNLGAQRVIALKSDETTTNTVTYFDFVYAGILCLALMNYNITNVDTQLTSFREQKILKRLQTTPLPVWKFMTAQIGSFLVLNVFQVIVLLIVGVAMFGAHIYGSYAGVVVLCLIGAVLFLAFGFFLASFTKTIRAASGLSVSISIIFMFMSGVFFPLSGLPNAIYQVVRWLPLSPMIQAMRNVALDAQPLADQWSYILIMLGWLVVLVVASAFTFRFSEE
ncbi:MAG: ABC transporter permease [Actinobacteria bacterium]|nr:ABC transporter permease [Actinomycetota bacterium]MBU1942599.1 ABC transporter permease [Actinomycetota bacterium]MBU2688725.1 ABC transporter permease [Actinomycetota bacterium]